MQEHPSKIIGLDVLKPLISYYCGNYYVIKIVWTPVELKCIKQYILSALH